MTETRELRGETKGGCSSGCEQAGSTNCRPSSWLSQHVSVLSLKLVEPGRDEGAARVETIRQPNSRPVEEATSCPGYSDDARGSSGAK